MGKEKRGAGREGDYGVNTAFTISQECMVSKAVFHWSSGQVPPRAGATSSCPLAIMAMTVSQMGQL